MIIYHRSSILESRAQVTVNTVNCVGVMGKGLAHEYRVRYPEMFSVYKTICNDGLLETGKLWLWKADDQWVLNFPTKKHWRNASKLDWIKDGLEKFVATYESRGISQISFPKLGCGNGNLDWEEVRPVMEEYLGELPIEIWIHDFEKEIGLPEHLEAFLKEYEYRTIPYADEDIWENINLISSKLGRKLMDLEHQSFFEVRIVDNVLMLESGDDRSFYSREELSDAWKIMAAGMLTKRKMGISSAREASRIISLFAMMPYTKVFEIGYPSTTQTEIAAQIDYSGSADVSNPPRPQTTMPWH